MTGLSTLSTAYTKVRDQADIGSIRELATASISNSNRQNEPTCQCPHCNEITSLSITMINPGESKTDSCSLCHTEFTVTFTEDHNWDIK